MRVIKQRNRPAVRCNGSGQRGNICKRHERLWVICPVCGAQEMIFYETPTGTEFVPEHWPELHTEEESDDEHPDS